MVPNHQPKKYEYIHIYILESIKKSETDLPMWKTIAISQGSTVPPPKKHRWDRCRRRSGDPPCCATSGVLGKSLGKPLIFDGQQRNTI